jgi:hypothetical protein|tara:strand:+ start:8 stop:538 length:531 start_codon:yes stop_codon:yes gene_type:complete
VALTKIRAGGVSSIPATSFPSGAILQTKMVQGTNSVSGGTSATKYLTSAAAWNDTEQAVITLTTIKANSSFHCFYSGFMYVEDGTADGNINTMYAYIGHSTSSGSGYTYGDALPSYWDARSGNTDTPNQFQCPVSGGDIFSLSHAAETTLYFSLKGVFTRTGSGEGHSVIVHEVAA